MKVRIVKRKLKFDGIERGMLEYRNHWWEKWRPLHQDGRRAYVAYLGDKPVQGESFYMSNLNVEQLETREQMLRYLMQAEEVYIGVRIGSEYHVGYDVASDESMEILRNLEE